MTQQQLDLPEAEYASQGDIGCPGCGLKLAWRHALKVLGPKTIIVNASGCGSIAWFPYSPAKLAQILPCLDSGASTASGVRAALDTHGDTSTTVAVWAGDGTTSDLGFQPLSGAAERNENILYICCDNEAYMNTGIQRSSATPWGAWTTTTPLPFFKPQPKKNVVEIMAAHRVPYVATLSIASVDDFVYKLRKAGRTKGFRYLHILVPCPTGWRFDPAETIGMARLAVQSRAFPLYEVEDGERWRVNVVPEPPVPVQEYLKHQRRFAHLSPDEIGSIQRQIDHDWALLLSKAGAKAGA